MAKLKENTLLTRPGTLDLVSLSAGDDVPDWAAGLVGEHLLADGPKPEADKAGGPDGSWTVVELREHAKTTDIDLAGATTKADILAAINEAG